MSISSIFSSFNLTPQLVQSQAQKVQQEFAQLGQDLQAGNLTAAQSDFATLTASQNNSTFLAPASNGPIAQALSQLSQDSQSGNLSAAQQAYTSLQQNFQSQATQGVPHHHHHHHGGEGSNQINQLFQQLGEDLQSGNLTEAKQAYSALVSDLPQTAQASVAQTGQSNTSGVSVTT